MLAGAAADWRSAEPYAALVRCDRTLFAWEWLRRNPVYRQAAEWGGKEEVRRLGLLAIEPPERGVPAARPFWHAGADPAVLIAIALPATGQGGFELERLASLATFRRDGDREHILLCDGYQAARLDIVSGTLANGPVRLFGHIVGLDDAAAPIEAARRLVALHRDGCFGLPCRPSSAQARRWANLLRVRDALLDGASTREIAAALFGPAVAGPRWRIESPEWRARVQRLVAAARHMAEQAPASLLL